jgi:serine protease inhibitor
MPFRASLCLVLALTLPACELPFGLGGTDRAPPEITELPRSLTTQELQIRSASNAFGFDLLREIVGEAPGESHFISPLSASMALGMTLNGAERSTFDAMRSTLRFGDLSRQEINAAYRGLLDLLADLDPRVTFHIANAVWHTDRLTPLPSFVEAVRGSFDATVSPIDFLDPGAPRTLNAWVRERTRNRIAGIVPDPLPNAGDVVMYLLNAIYFNGDWTERFDRRETRTGDFHLADGSRAPVRYMVRAGGIRVGGGQDHQVVELPYGGKAFAMTVVIPRDPAGLTGLIRELDEVRWNALVSTLGEESGRARIHLPRFSLEWERSLVETLEALGMGEAFAPGRADFSGLFGDGGLVLSDVRHKTFLRVDEEGTEAAVVTSVGVEVVSAPPEIRVDRPFLFALRERLTGTVLFLGAVAEAPVDPGS